MKRLSEFHNVAILLRRCQEIVGHYSPGVVQVDLAYKLSSVDAENLMDPDCTL